MRNQTHRNRQEPHLRRVLGVTLALGIILPITACATQEPQSSNSAEVEQAVALAVDASRVQVIGTGEGEKRVLSYEDLPADGETAEEQEVTLSVSDGFSQTVAPAAQANPLAPAGGDVSTMRFPLTATVSAAGASETESLSATRAIRIWSGQPAFTDVDLAEDIRSGEGFELGIRANDLGQQSSVSFAAPVNATDTGRLMLEQYLLKYTSLPIIFPAEPVGTGASWTVDSRVTGESTLLQTVTYTVNALRGSEVELDVDISQRPSLGAIDITGEQAGEQAGNRDAAPAQLTVLNSNTTSTGSLTVDLSRPVPTGGEVSWTTRIIYGGSDNDTRVIQDSTSSLSFS
ncbi:hypothetical protein [Corynebacterium pacaense]|uniref:hypothetical protein n=1 Tax=Corynebacterium pacaense TaxID=1816684 RepID=UPI001177C7E2|nr:hypothetical protein [Corynebacterium pacaense]